MVTGNVPCSTRVELDVLPQSRSRTQITMPFHVVPSADGTRTAAPACSHGAGA
jgi:hypothetical protein